MLLTCSDLPPIQWAALPASAMRHWREEVAVCRVSVSKNLPHAQRLLVLLPEAEQLRARRYHAEADYIRFIIGRATLRLLLGSCLGQPPGSLHFEVGPNRKPVLATAPHLHYNVAHAGEWVLIAIGPVEIGVDIEKVDAGFPFQELLSHSFSLAEQAFITQQPAPAAAFYQFWTRKEAFVKATAQGIDADFSQVPALDGPHEWAAMHPSATTEWETRSFIPAPDYVAALTCPAAVSARQIRFYEVDLFPILNIL